MAREQVIVGIDIGSTNVRTLIGHMVGDEHHVPQITGVGIAPSSGMRRGSVIDVEEMINTITRSVEEAERMSGEPVDHAVISVNGASLQSINSRGFISVGRSDGEITYEDTERALEAAQAIQLPPNRKILKIVPRSYTVDDQIGIKDPIGMTGIRLEVDAHIISGSIPSIKNITKCVHQTGIDIDDYMPSMLAASEAVLTKRQKELGVTVIDIGGGCVSMAVFEEGNILHTAVIPVGGGHITNDIAIGLRTSIDTAEKVKIEYGTCLPGEIKSNEQVDLSSISSIDTQVISRHHLSQIIEARVQEIFVLAKEELRVIGRDGMLPAGAILTGGSVKLPGMVDIAKEVLSLPVQVGFPLELEGVVDRIDDPAFASSIGLLLSGTKGDKIRFSRSPVIKNVTSWFKSFIK